MTKTLLTASALLLVASSAFAAPKTSKAPQAKPAAKVAATTFPATCPVTGEKIASAKDAAGHSVYNGKTYYFCCSSCKPSFDKNPAKYVKSASAAPKAGAPAKM